MFCRVVNLVRDGVQLCFTIVSTNTMQNNKTIAFEKKRMKLYRYADVGWFGRLPMEYLCKPCLKTMINLRFSIGLCMKILGHRHNRSLKLADSTNDIFFSSFVVSF